MAKPNLRIVGNTERAEDQLAMNTQRDQQSVMMIAMVSAVIGFWLMAWDPRSYIIRIV